MRQDEGYSKPKIGAITKQLYWDGYDITYSILSLSLSNHHPPSSPPIRNCVAFGILL